MNANLVIVLSLIVLTSIFDTINQLFLKSAINSLDASLSPNIFKIMKFIFRLIRIPRIWIGFLFCCLSLCVWLLVLSIAELNFAFSVDSMHYIFIAIASSLLLKEKVGLQRWVGTFFIVIGIVLVALS